MQEISETCCKKNVEDQLMPETTNEQSCDLKIESQFLRWDDSV